MIPWFLPYDLQDGYIHNWLVAGPQIMLQGEPRCDSGAGEPAPTSLWSDSGITETPVERGTFIVGGPDGSATKLTWDYRGVEEDHLVDMAGSYPADHTLEAWAYSELVPSDPCRVTLVLHSFGPAQLWLNGQLLCAQDGSSARLPHGATCEVDLAKGANGLLVRFGQVTTDVAPLAIAVQVVGVEGHAVRVRIPTLNKKTKKHQTIERWAQRAYLEHDLYAAEQKLLVKWIGPIRSPHRLMVRIEKPSGYFIAHVERPLEPKVSFNLLEATSALDGSYTVRVCPEFEEYIKGMVFSRDMDVGLLHNAHVERSQDTYDQRGRELLDHTLWWNEGLYSELARMALAVADSKGWTELQQGVIQQAVEAAAAHGMGSSALMLGLLLIAYRYMKDEAFPQALRAPLEACILGYDYGRDQARVDAGLAGDLAIVSYACQVLAGQLYPDRAFAGSEQPGQWHRQRGEQGALAWLARRAYGGFSAWDSAEAFGAMLPALVALVDYASSEALGDLAAVLADKLLFTLAVNSFKGVLGSPQGATSATSVVDGRMQPTSPVSRLLWGMGSWNQHPAAAMGLVGSEQYGAPEILEIIAADQPDEVWAREGHVVAWSGDGPEATPAQRVNIATYKTPDAMLASAQDYRPGEPGQAEHIWQATLGPDAVVFTSHPTCLSQKKAYQPNFWCGNGVLPRVAQWKDLLIALYRLPDDDWLGYTHAHFPLAALDEHTLEQGWVFARKGEAYLALKAAQGFTLVKSGNSAYRELRSPGTENVWLCQLGRAARDGTFADFREKVLATNLAVTGLQVAGTSLRGDQIAFDWVGRLMVNGMAQPLDGFRHYENPYCVCDYGASVMEIHAAGWMLRLDQGTPLK